MNRLELIGYLGKDPELRETSSGLAICNIRLATQERRKNKDDDWKVATTWHDVTCFGKTAETCCKYAMKGSLLRVEARLGYEPIEGTSHHVANITAIRLDILGNRKPVETSIQTASFSHSVIDENLDLRCNNQK
jgi:single-strand DNA-binding protein